MKDCFRRLLPPCLGLLFFAGAFLGSCTDVDDQLGLGLLPDDQEMIFNQTVLDGINTYQAFSDELPVNQKNMMALGNYQTDRFGHLRSGAVIQFVPSYFSDTDDFYGYRPVVDSMQIVLSISSVYGDTTKQQKFYIYEMKEQLPARDTLFYPGFDAELYADMSTKLFSFTLGSDIGTVAKDLEFEEGAEAFLKRLTGASHPDGAADEYGKRLYTDSHADSLFHTLFKGWYITPSDDPAEAPEDAGFYIVSPLSTYNTTYLQLVDDSWLNVFSHNFYADPADSDKKDSDKETIDGNTYYRKDTLTVMYSFDDTYISYPNVNIMVLDRDYSGADFDPDDFIKPDDFKSGTIPSEDPIYVQGLLGVAGYLDFGDDFLRQLKALTMVDGEERILNVNRARMHIWLEDDGAKYLDMAPTRLGMYYNYKGVYPTPIPDFDYTNEILYASNNYTSPYLGFLNRSLGYYEMDITAYVRHLANKAEETQQQVWLGPAAHSSQMFEPVQVILQNPKGPGPDGEPDHRRITVDLTYTLHKKSE